MKTNPFLALLSAIALGACAAPTTPMATSPQASAAQGKVTAKSTSNDNTRVEIEVKHLAPADRVAADAHLYIVWARPRDGGQPQNLGALKPNADAEASMQTVTPLKRFDLLVTPESTPAVTAPSHEPVLTASIDR
jgi:hypothetical protein